MTLSVMKKLHGGRVAFIFPVVIIGLMIIVGLGVNFLLGDSASIVSGTDFLDDHSWLDIMAGVLLLSLFVESLFRNSHHGMLENL